MNVKFILGALLCAPLTVSGAEWFEANTPLIQAHQHLLNNDLANMFTSMVLVWQNNNTPTNKAHLNDLFNQSITANCGKGLDTSPLPEWLKNITIRRINIQSPGREANQLLVDVLSNQNIKNISFVRWVDEEVSKDSSMSTQGDSVTLERTFIKRYNMNSELPMGLYRLIITKNDNTNWSTWIIIEQSKTNHVIHWVSKDTWSVEKTAIPNPYCPLPKLDVAIYNFEEGKYSEIWRNSYESDYPTAVPLENLPSNRYVLAVSMNYQRWQGQITIEQSQVISKTYDVTVDE
jgi:hypothetical protein